MPRLNLPQTLPTFPSHGSQLLSSKAVTSGQQTVFYGPGQPITSSPGDTTFLIAPQPTVDPFWIGSPMGTSYQPPDDWVPPASFLIFPQVVFVSVFFDEMFMVVKGAPLPSGDGYIYGTSGPPFMAPTIDPQWIGVDTAPNTYISAVKAAPNLYYREWLRLNQVITDVSIRLAKIRQNTWMTNTSLMGVVPPGVGVIERYGPSPGDPCFSSSFRYVDGTTPCVLGPGGGQGDWLGTDFLHIYVGHPAFDQGNARSKAISADSGTVAAIPSNAAYQNSVSRLKAAYPRFRGHSTWFYDVTWLPWPTTDSGIPPQVRAFYESDIAPYTVLAQSAYFANNVPLIMAVDSNAAAAFQLIAQQNGTLNLSHKGPSDKLTADTLLQEIATYFRFDPGTGRDL